jgi:hypothetical protein
MNPESRKGSGEDTDASEQPERLGPQQAAAAALEQISKLTPKEPEGVTSLEPTDAGWMVEVEVLEDRRIPSSTDMLALYEVEIDGAGNLVSYRRTRRYSRGSSEVGEDRR